MLSFFAMLFSMAVAPKLVQISSISQYGVVWVAQLARLKPCPLCHTKIGALPITLCQNCGLPTAPRETWQPCPQPQSASTASSKQDPSYNVPVESGTPGSLPRSPFVAGEFWAVILYHPVRERHCASDVVLPKTGGHR